MLALLLATAAAALVVPSYRLRGIPVDGVLLHCSFAYALSTWTEETSLLAVAFGFCFASFERYCIGYTFHLPRFETQHEAFHELLRQRKRSISFLLVDHVSETIAYAILFAMMYVLVLQWLALPLRYGLQLGMLAEHVVGQRIRWRVQIFEMRRPEESRAWWERIQDNWEAYYWHHILVDPHSCRGFSAPFWDTLFGSNPFASRYTWCGPVPYLEFCFVDYTQELRDIIYPAWQAYCIAPNDFGYNKEMHACDVE